MAGTLALLGQIAAPATPRRTRFSRLDRGRRGPGALAIAGSCMWSMTGCRRARRSARTSAASAGRKGFDNLRAGAASCPLPSPSPAPARMCPSCLTIAGCLMWRAGAGPLAGGHHGAGGDGECHLQTVGNHGLCGRGPEPRGRDPALSSIMCCRPSGPPAWSGAATGRWSIWAKVCPPGWTSPPPSWRASARMSRPIYRTAPRPGLSAAGRVKAAPFRGRSLPFQQHPALDDQRKRIKPDRDQHADRCHPPRSSRIQMTPRLVQRLPRPFPVASHSAIITTQQRAAGPSCGSPRTARAARPGSRPAATAAGAGPIGAGQVQRAAWHLRKPLCDHHT